MIRPQPTFGIIGLNFKHVKLAVLEQLAVRPDQQVWLLQQLAQEFGLQQLVLLSTCNRVELYYGQNQGVANPDAIFKSLAQHQKLGCIEGQKIYQYQGNQALEHLLKVTAGFDSMILGELQIVNQVKLALQQSFRCKMAAGVLAQAFHLALSFSKEVRANFCTNSPSSISHLAVHWLQKQMQNLNAQRVLVVGAGKMAKLMVQQLQSAGVENITCTSRNANNAKALALRHHLKWQDLDAGLEQADIVVTATSANHIILTKQQVSLLVAKRQQPLWLLDISMPRNIEPAILKMPGVRLVDLESLHEFSRTVIQAPQLFLIEPFLEKAVQSFNRWQAVWRVAPLIQDMRQRWRANSKHQNTNQQSAKQLHQLTMQIRQRSIDNQLNLNDPRLLTKNLEFSPTLHA